jgi:hypothetical protein
MLHLSAVVLLRFQAGQCICGMACCCCAAKLCLPQAILVGAHSLVLRIAGAAQPADHCVWLGRLVEVAITKRPSDDHATWMGPPAELYSAVLWTPECPTLEANPRMRSLKGASHSLQPSRPRGPGASLVTPRLMSAQTGCCATVRCDSIRQPEPGHSAGLDGY